MVLSEDAWPVGLPILCSTVEALTEVPPIGDPAAAAPIGVDLAVAETASTAVAPAEVGRFSPVNVHEPGSMNVARYAPN